MADIDEYNTENLNYEAEVSDAGDGAGDADNDNEMEVQTIQSIGNYPLINQLINYSLINQLINYPLINQLNNYSLINQLKQSINQSIKVFRINQSIFRSIGHYSELSHFYLAL